MNSNEDRAKFLQTLPTVEQSERLALLAEEASEVIQIVGKIMRHGIDSTHPYTGESNRHLLEKEIGDFLGAISLMVVAGDISEENIRVHIIKRKTTVNKYLHFNEVK